MKKLIVIFLVLFLVVVGQAQELKKEDLLKNIPKEYNKLLEAYTKVVELAFTYKKLYEEAEKSNERLIRELEALNSQFKAINETLQRLEKTVDVLQAVILKILDSGKMSGVGLYNIKDGSIMLGLTYRF